VKFRGSRSLREPALSTSKGFTLVELLIGATLSAAVMAAVFSSYIYLGRSLARLANQQTLETEARRALGHFAQDVEQAAGISGTPSASTVTLKIPAGASGTTTVTYAFTNDANNNGTLTRTPASGPAVVLLRNILNNGLTLRYYDSASTEYPNAAWPAGYYLESIKQLSLEFSTQTGSAPNGTRTFVQQTASGRLILRNRGFLP
jgi:Tfp pilus assembly protein PilW